MVLHVVRVRRSHQFHHNTHVEFRVPAQYQGKPLNYPLIGYYPNLSAWVGDIYVPDSVHSDVRGDGRLLLRPNVWGERCSCCVRYLQHSGVRGQCVLAVQGAPRQHDVHVAGGVSVTRMRRRPLAYKPQ
ncbi:uncharacterized protein LOC113507151 [Trichoplusia ni]|uniref:Uncharacterized protein LOC113507151 n=1 Tax=Trichoplusia ni TaxID=7111 RepID=A0A7E5WY75_TRINI|nr:uncharacterized protein LOC113507151 [Trichoplusia ni]